MGTAAQVAARYKEKQTIKARSKEKAKAVYREHAILKALVDKGEFAANVPAMSKRLKEIGGNDTLTAAAKIVAQMKYLKLQRSFLEHVWARKKLLPVLQAPLVAGAKRRKAWTPEQFHRSLAWCSRPSGRTASRPTTAKRMVNFCLCSPWTRSWRRSGRSAAHLRPSGARSCERSRSSSTTLYWRN